MKGDLLPGKGVEAFPGIRLLQPNERSLVEELDGYANAALARDPPNALAWRYLRGAALLVAKRLARVDVDPDELINFEVSR